MKILSAEQIKAADAYTIDNEPITSIDLMERASYAFVEAFSKKVSKQNPIVVVCGTGNNGGDGLAIARLLYALNYSVAVYIVQPNDSGSEDFKTNLNRLEANLIHWIRTANDIPSFDTRSIIIDGIFGSGLTRKITGLHADVIAKMNDSGAIIYAIDVPSGLFLDQPTSSDAVARASFTFSFQMPKLAFFFPENATYVGEWNVLDIGLDRQFITAQSTSYEAFDLNDARMLLSHRPKFAHKGTFGHGQLIAGSYGKMGAAVLAATAFLRSGGGLLSVTAPRCGTAIMQSALPEAMVVAQSGQNCIEEFNILDNVNAVGIGPGMGQEKVTLQAFKTFLQQNTKDLVLDADAINLLASHRELIEILPHETILTPHLKEFDRLAGPSDDHWLRLVKAQNICSERNLIIVLKGAHTAVINTNGNVSFNTTGNPGMATAGSGDVLLGIITGLRAQGMDAFNAARLGVYLHGLAGDIAATNHSEYSMLAGDIHQSLGKAFKQILSEPFIA